MMRERHRKQLPVWALALTDAALIGVTLVIYALFQHVIPAYRGTSSAAVTTETTVVAQTEAAPVPEQTLAEKFADHFTDTVVVTDTSYSGPNAAVEITEHETKNGSGSQIWYEAQIYLSDISLLQSATPGTEYSTSADDIVQTSLLHSAIVAVNGDYAAFGDGGLIVRNGILRRNVVSQADSCILYSDGTVKCCTGSTPDAETELQAGAWQIWTFGPSLLNEDGSARTEFSDFYSSVTRGNPRTAFGYYEPGHYCFVVVDGRQEGASGMTLAELAETMQELGCTAAYNLDGGKSSQMTFNGSLVNSPVDDGRVVNDILMVSVEGEPEK